MIVWAARRYGWTPRQVRQCSWRDLQLLMEAARTEPV